MLSAKGSSDNGIDGIQSGRREIIAKKISFMIRQEYLTSK